MKSIYCILSIFLMVLGCAKDKKENGAYAYLGGEIVNPTANTVIVLKSKKVIDTIALDRNNRFSYTFKNLESGIYSFYHDNEYQSLVIEPEDSILFRLNTMDFDESLFFTGKGAKKNNYLIKLYLENEREHEYVLRISQLNAIQFQKKIDSIKLRKEIHIKHFIKKNNPSKLFQKVATSNIVHSYYAAKELYPFVNYNSNELNNLKNLPKNFYSYRKNIDYNDEVLKNYYPYYSFLRMHFNNIALKAHFEHSADSVYKRSSLDYNLDKFKIINARVKNEEIKNALLNSSLFYFLSTNKNTQEYSVILDAYKKYNTDKSQIENATQLVNSYLILKPNQDLSHFVLLDTNNKTHTLKQLITKPTAVYFWSYNNKKHFLDSHKKIKELKIKYPEVNFIGVNLNDELKPWVSALTNQYYKHNNEYQLAESELKNTLRYSPINRVLLITKKGKIVNPKANLFTFDFEQEIVELLNR